MPPRVTPETLFWAEIGDNRIGPLMRELIEALAESNDPHLVRKVSRRIRLMASSLEAMSHHMAENHNREECPICKNGSTLQIIS
jgi:hypothetical protein